MVNPLYHISFKKNGKIRAMCHELAKLTQLDHAPLAIYHLKASQPWVSPALPRDNFSYSSIKLKAKWNLNNQAKYSKHTNP